MVKRFCQPVSKAFRQLIPEKIYLFFAEKFYFLINGAYAEGNTCGNGNFGGDNYVLWFHGNGAAVCPHGLDACVHIVGGKGEVVYAAGAIGPLTNSENLNDTVAGVEHNCGLFALSPAAENIKPQNIVIKIYDLFKFFRIFASERNMVCTFYELFHGEHPFKTFLSSYQQL